MDMKTPFCPNRKSRKVLATMWGVRATLLSLSEWRKDFRYLFCLDEAASVVRFHLCEEARYVNGANIHLSGGWRI